MKTMSPGAPKVIDGPLMLGGETSNLEAGVPPGEPVPLTITMASQIPAASSGAGTLAMMLVSLQVDGVTGALQMLSVLLPWSSPNPLPLIVTDVPTGPKFGDTLLTTGVV